MTLSLSSALLLMSVVLAPGIVIAGGYMLMRSCREPAERVRIVWISMLAALVAPLLVFVPQTPKLQLGWIPSQTSQPIEEAAIADPGPAAVQPAVPVELTGSDLPLWRSPPLPADDTQSHARQSLPVPSELIPSDQAKTDNGLLLPGDLPTAERAAIAPAVDPRLSILDRTVMGLGVVYAGFAMLLLARLWVGHWQLRQLIRRAAQPNAHVMREIMSADPSRSRKASLRVSKEIDAPLIGLPFTPTILIPEEMANGTDRRALRFGLIHELAHLANRDLWSWSFVNGLQVLFGWHPCYWRMRSELRCSQDLIADAQTAAANDQRPDYAEVLLSIARQRRSALVCNALTMGDTQSNLYRRITMLVTSKTLPAARCRRRVWVPIGMIALLAVVVSMVRLDKSQAAPISEPLSPTAEHVSLPDDESDEKEAEAQDKPARMEWQGKRLEYTGKVTDKRSGEPIAGATVTIIRSILTSREHTPLAETEHETDMNGEYSFVVEPEHTEHAALYIELKASHPDYASIGPMGYAMSMIRKNETLGARPFYEDVSLHPAEPLTGVIVGPDDKPLAGVQIVGYSALDLDDFRDYGSFTRTVTEADGSFRLNLIKEGSGVFWILPEEHAIRQLVVDLERGDLGRLKVEEGIRLSGQVLDARGNPVPDVFVNIETIDRNDDAAILNRVASSVRRGAKADSEGRFTFKPLPAGNYTVTPDEHLREPTISGRRQRNPLPAVFIRQPVTLTAGVPPEAIELQAIPHVLVRGQYFDSKGETCRGHAAMVFGQIDGQTYFAQARPDENGKIECPVPHGLEDTYITLMTNEHGVLRYRMGKDGELKSASYLQIMMGTLEDDTAEIQIIRYKAPIVVVEAVDEEGKRLKDIIVSASYEWGDQRFILPDGSNTDISFEEQSDGRHRSSQMLPDENVTIKVTAEGYEPGELEINLSEGEREEVKVQLKKTK